MSDFMVLGGKGCEFCTPVPVGEGCGTCVPKLTPGERCLFCGRQEPFIKLELPHEKVFNFNLPMFPPPSNGVRFDRFPPPWGPLLPGIYFK